MYYNWKKYESITDTPVTVQEIKRILSECKIIDIAAKEELPQGKVIIVGVGNDDYEWHELWDLKYTNHREYTYGGYFNEDHSGYHSWWTMNYNYSDKYDKTKMYILKNTEDAEKLKVFLNFTGGLNNLLDTIYNKEKELKKLQKELEYLSEAKKIIS
jgi:cell division protein FtsL